MYRKVLIAFNCLLLFLFSSQSIAEAKLTYDESMAVFNGNTIEGIITNHDVAYTMYLDPSGSLVRKFRGTVEKGNWRINQKGKFCIEFGQEKCRKIKKRDDGGYNAYNRHDELKFTIDKVLPGNPNKY